MGINVNWGDSNRTLIHAIFEGEWDWYAFYAAAGEIARLMMSVEHPVDVILDLKKNPHIPAAFLIHTRRAKFYKLHRGVIVIIQNGTPWQVRLNALRDLARSDLYGRVMYAPSLNSATAIIERQRQQREKPRAAPRRNRLVGFLFR